MVAPPEARALTMGAYTACLDLALSVAGPTLGALAGAVGVASVFLASGGLVPSAPATALALRPHLRWRRVTVVLITLPRFMAVQAPKTVLLRHQGIPFDGAS